MFSSFYYVLLNETRHISIIRNEKMLRWASKMIVKKYLENYFFFIIKQVNAEYWKLNKNYSNTEKKLLIIHETPQKLFLTIKIC